MRAWSFVLFTAILLAGCSEEVGGAAGDPAGAGAGSASGNEGTELIVDVPESGRVYLDLAAAKVITPANDGGSTDWHLALSGYDVLTNSGPSGPGEGSAFGPLDPIDFLGDVAPVVPFLAPDTTGGAFIDWWKYDNTAHVIWSRYHVYGVKDGARLWKVQILSFYGEEQGAPVSALYKARFAEVLATGLGPITTLSNIDGTAGGPSPPTTAPSDCLDLDSGALIPLTPPEALASKAWHLCFRRSEIAVNGEYGGPRGVLAADIDAAKTSGETLEEIKAKSADTELARFEGIDSAALTAPEITYRGDRIVTAFTDQWVEKGSDPPAPRDSAWFIMGPDDASKFLLRFEKFEGATAKSPGKVTLRVKTVK
jgi:hypothetical protein